MSIKAMATIPTAIADAEAPRSDDAGSIRCPFFCGESTYGQA
jgi:hypothetical protein